MPLLLMTLTAQFVGPSPSVTQAQRFSATVPVELDYLLTLPQGYDENPETRYPLVLFLHGWGERGDDLEKVKTHGLPKHVAAGREFPFILVAPQSGMRRWWQPVELLALLDQIEATHRVDRDRIYITGLSMGGYGTWNTAGMDPDRFAAAAPICGGGNGVLTRLVGTLPIRAYHGDADPVVPVFLSRDLVREVNERGGNAELIEYPGVGHDSWTRTYDDPDFYKWLLSHKRSDRPAADDSPAADGGSRSKSP